MVTEAGQRGEGDASPTVNGIMIFLLLGCWYCASISSLSLGTVLRFSSSSLNVLLWDDCVFLLCVETALLLFSFLLEHDTALG